MLMVSAFSLSYDTFFKSRLKYQHSKLIKNYLFYTLCFFNNYYIPW